MTMRAMTALEVQFEEEAARGGFRFGRDEATGDCYVTGAKRTGHLFSMLVCEAPNPHGGGSIYTIDPDPLVTEAPSSRTAASSVRKPRDLPRNG